MACASWRVLILEDDVEVRRFFEASVHAHEGLQLAASFGWLEEARAWLANGGQADVLLTDLALPDGHALSLLREVARTRPDCEVLVVSVLGDEETVLACVEAGAVGYIQKDSTQADVARIIMDVKRGASPISPMIARKLLTRMRRISGDAAGSCTEDGATSPAASPSAPAPASAQLLTPREAEVLDLIARGYSYAEIARLQGITKHTVQGYIKNLYSKLAVHSRGEAVFEAGRMGLLSGGR